MIFSRKGIAFGLIGALGAAVLFFTLAFSDAFVRDVWTREHPLKNPIMVTGVLDGVVTLADGRKYRPAGIRRRENVTPIEFDRALTAATRQGVEVVRDLGDGRAFLQVEPKFYNWCGTHGVWTRWRGLFAQGPLSEMLIYTRYASEQLAEPGLTERERWQLHGVHYFDESHDEPRRLSPDANSFRFEGSERYFHEIDIWIERLSRMPSPP